MLVLERKCNEGVEIAVPGWPVIRVCVVGVRDGKVKLGFEATKEVVIDRDEVAELKRREVLDQQTSVHAKI